MGLVLTLLLLGACASGGSARTGGQAAGAGVSPQECDGDRARVEKTLWPTGTTAPRLTRSDVPDYVTVAGRMLLACSALATGTHQRERELGLVAAGDVLGRDLVAMRAMSDSELVLATPAHAERVRRYLSLIDALRGRSR